MPRPTSPRRLRVVAALIETFGFSPWLASAVLLFFLALAAAAMLWLILSAPPRTLTIVTGPSGSSFQHRAERYRDKLAEQGVKLIIVPSDGSLDNLHRLEDRTQRVDVGFVQAGLVGDDAPPGLVSLGSLSYQPLWVFYRGDARITRLSELAGKRLGVGASGSGTQALAHALLEANEITGAPTQLVEQPSDAASKDFLDGKLDALFLMGDSAPTSLLRTLNSEPGVHPYSFVQADAYVRRRNFDYLSKVVVPQGAIDLAHNVPAQDITLLAPTVDLIAREGLNSAMSDLLLDVARQVEGRAAGFAKRGEFPAPLDGKIPLSDDAARFYKSGKGITYRVIHSFWLASLINRLLVAIVPIVLVLIPAIRFLPVAYRWSVQLRIYRCYRPLLRLERDALAPLTPERGEELLRRLDEIERNVSVLKVPASFASQFYDLRNHVAFVRNRLKHALLA